MRNVIKRDGRVVEFNSGLIDKALISAYKSVGINLEDSYSRDAEEYRRISKNIVKDLPEEVTVEQIQNKVEATLKKENIKVYNAFKTFREKRRMFRNKNNIIIKKMLNIIQTDDVQNSNANVDEYTFGGRKFESAGLIHKEVAKTMLRPEVLKAKEDNANYIHDFDSYDIGMHNCLFADVAYLLKNGLKNV